MVRLECQAEAPMSRVYDYIFSSVCMLSPFGHVQLFATLWAVAHQAPLSKEISRQEYWSGLPFPSPSVQFRKHLLRINYEFLFIFMYQDLVLIFYQYSINREEKRTRGNKGREKKQKKMRFCWQFFINEAMRVPSRSWKTRNGAHWLNHHELVSQTPVL